MQLFDGFEPLLNCPHVGFCLNWRLLRGLEKTLLLAACSVLMPSYWHGACWSALNLLRFFKVWGFLDEIMLGGA